MPKRKPKPKTPEQIRKDADTHRQKKYGVGLDYYDSQLEKQDGGCGVCGAPPGTRRLHIDHDHSWTKVGIAYRKLSPGLWHGYAKYLGKPYEVASGNKSGVSKKMKSLLKQASVRGLLCYSHNAGLQKFQDNPKYLRAAAKYLEDHQETA